MSETSDEGQSRHVAEDEEESMDHATSQSQFSDFQEEYKIWASQSQHASDLFEVSQSQETVKTDDIFTLSQTQSSQESHMGEPRSQTSGSDTDYNPGSIGSLYFESLVSLGPGSLSPGILRHGSLSPGILRHGSLTPGILRHGSLSPGSPFQYN